MCDIVEFYPKKKKLTLKCEVSELGDALNYLNNENWKYTTTDSQVIYLVRVGMTYIYG